MEVFRFTETQRKYLARLIAPRYELEDIVYNDVHGFASVVCRKAAGFYTRRVVFSYDTLLSPLKGNVEALLRRRTMTPGMLP